LSEYRDIVKRYCDGVMDGKVITGRLVKLAVQRHLEDLEQAGKRGYYFDAALATKSIEFFPMCLRHTKGRWRGKVFDPTPSQAFILWNIFGWRRRDNDCRRFGKAYLSMARKNGKSEFAAGVSLKQLVFDHPRENAAEVYNVATKEDQARDIVFRQAQRMAELGPLKSRLRIMMKSVKTMLQDPYQPDSILRPVGSDSATSDGYDLSTGILDEIHAWRKRHEGLYEKLTTAGGAREQELILIITTAGDEFSELWERLDTFNAGVLEGVATGEIVSDHSFAFVATIDEDDDPFDPANWPKANPNYPEFPSHEYLTKQAADMQDRPETRNTFIRFHANRRVQGRNKPITANRWNDLAGEPCKSAESSHGGIDFGRSDDFSSWAVVVPKDPYQIISRSYTCSERPKHLRTAQVAEWISSGWLVEHPGNSVDFMAMYRDLCDIRTQYGVKTWAFDPAFAKVIGQMLAEEFGAEAAFQFTQSPRHYNEPVRTFLKEYHAGNIQHDGDRCLAWQMTNLATVPNARDELMPAKGGSREYKIDAAVAVLMAFSECLFAERKDESIYETGEGLML